jgi:hypothetical protein
VHSRSTDLAFLSLQGRVAAKLLQLAAPAGQGPARIPRLTQVELATMVGGVASRQTKRSSRCRPAATSGSRASAWRSSTRSRCAGWPAAERPSLPLVGTRRRPRSHTRWAALPTGSPISLPRHAQVKLAVDSPATPQPP